MPALSSSRHDQFFCPGNASTYPIVRNIRAGSYAALAETIMLKILIVYWNNAPTMRITTQDHLYCFERHLEHEITYLNVEEDVDESALRKSDFDIIIFHDLFFCGRWGGPPLFNRLCAKIDVLREYNAVKLAIPQDEFISADLLCEFINDFDVHAVFSVTPPSEWPKVYRDIDRDKIRLYAVLTGYLESETLAAIDALDSNPSGERPIDIGYRAGGRNWRQASWLGRHGMLKIEIADQFSNAAPAHGLRTDISTRSEDTFAGKDWYKFLLRCKYTIGLEGGASILDWDGTIRPKTLAFVEQHPNSTLEEIEAACFPGLDGTLALFALSPRHLEACATRTCQILIEGEYNGVLEPWRHYIPVKRDFSDLDAVLKLLEQDELRERLVKQAYQDVVESDRYTYKRFAEFVIAEARAIKPEMLDGALRNIARVPAHRTKPRREVEPEYSGSISEQPRADSLLRRVIRRVRRTVRAG
jgi:hypothetical protein